MHTADTLSDRRQHQPGLIYFYRLLVLTNRFLINVVDLMTVISASGNMPFQDRQLLKMRDKTLGRKLSNMSGRRAALKIHFLPQGERLCIVGFCWVISGRTLVYGEPYTKTILLPPFC